jgi:hypothetical protein
MLYFGSERGGVMKKLAIINLFLWIIGFSILLKSFGWIACIGIFVLLIANNIDSRIRDYPNKKDFKIIAKDISEIQDSVDMLMKGYNDIIIHLHRTARKE